MKLKEFSYSSGGYLCFLIACKGKETELLTRRITSQQRQK